MVSKDDLAEIAIDNESKTLMSAESKRREEPWNERSEKLIMKWRDECVIVAKKHDAKGYVNKSRYKTWALPNIVLTVVMSGVSGALGDEHYMKYMAMSGFVVSGIITGISSLYNFGKLTQQHFDFSTRYSELALQIDAEMVKGRSFRTPSDVFSLQARMKFEQLNRNAPVL
jgi:hypothetical protein